MFKCTPPNILVLTICLFWLFSNRAVAQENFLPGFIITNNGDTIRGFIEYKERVISPEKILFKLSNNASPEIYFPTDIMSFQVENQDIYVSKEVELDVSPWRLDEIQHGVDAKFEKRKVFLQAIVIGHANLYYHQGGDHKLHFFIEKLNEINELRLVQTIDKYGYLFRNRLYIGQLKLYMQDCDPGNIERTSFSTKSLKSLFIRYNQCISPNQEQYVIKEEKFKLKFNLIAGMNATKLSFEGPDFPGLHFADLSWSYRPFVGVSLNLILPRNQERFQFALEFFYKDHDVNGTSRAILNTRDFNDYRIHLKNSHLQTSFLFRYQLKKDRTPYFNFGVSLSKLLSKEYESVRDVFSSGQLLRTETKLELSRYNNLEKGIIAGIGYKLNKLKFEARYQVSDGLSGGGQLKSETDAILLGVKYEL